MSRSDHIWDFSDNRVSNRQTSLYLESIGNAVVIGVGGIGSWVAFNLALCGKVEHLYLFDDDVIETSNLNRTPFRIFDIGHPKCEAMMELILERRPTQKVYPFCIKFNPSLLECEPNVIFDCRDDIYDDLCNFKCKIWKLGYDGLELTIDGNPKGRKVWGESQGYTVTPSFFAPSQLVSTLVIIDTLTSKSYVGGWESNNSFNDVITFNCCDIIPSLQRVQEAMNSVIAMHNQGDPVHASS